MIKKNIYRQKTEPRTDNVPAENICRRRHCTGRALSPRFPAAARLIPLLLLVPMLLLTAGCTGTTSGQPGADAVTTDSSLTESIQTPADSDTAAAARETSQTPADSGKAAAARETADTSSPAGENALSSQSAQSASEGPAAASPDESGTLTTSGASAESGTTGAAAEAATEITFTAVGDNLINEVLYGQAAEYAVEAGSSEAWDFTPCYASVAPFIREHDVNWIDIETLMTDTLEPSGYPAFSTPGASGRALYDAGWRVFSICSNHTYDLGTDGITETLAFWDEMAAQAHDQITAKICWTGLWRNGTEDQIPVLECKGKKLAFLTYTYGTNDIELPEDAPAHVIYLSEEDKIARQIRLAHEQADAVIVSLHWGEEYSHIPTQDQRDLAQRVADMGADLIIGGHPHVVQPAEMLTAADGRKVFCAYSLGNFICAQNAMPDPDAMIGLLLSCTFRFDPEGQVTVADPQLIPILSDYKEDYADDHVVLYRDYSEEEALAHGMRSMFDFTQFDYDYVRSMLTRIVGKKYLQLP